MPVQDHMRARLDLTLKNKGAYVNKALIALDKNANEKTYCYVNPFVLEVCQIVL